MADSTPFYEALADHRSGIVKEWLKRFLQTYPESTTKFLSQERDPFHNPVGHTLKEGLSNLFDGLIQSTDVASLTPVLDSIVRIRAVQDFTASQALDFPFLLKQVIRSEFAADIPRYSSELAAFEVRIDELALLAFDLFMKCREQIYESKVNEIKRRFFIMERAEQKRQARTKRETR